MKAWMVDLRHPRRHPREEEVEARIGAAAGAGEWLVDESREVRRAAALTHPLVAECGQTIDDAVDGAMAESTHLVGRRIERRAPSLGQWADSRSARRERLAAR